METIIIFCFLFFCSTNKPNRTGSKYIPWIRKLLCRPRSKTLLKFVGQDLASFRTIFLPKFFADHICFELNLDAVPIHERGPQFYELSFLKDSNSGPLICEPMPYHLGHNLNLDLLLAFRTRLSWTDRTPWSLWPHRPHQALTCAPTRSRGSSPCRQLPSDTRLGELKHLSLKNDPT